MCMQYTVNSVIIKLKGLKCPFCSSGNLQKDNTVYSKYNAYQCKDCNKLFTMKK